MNKHREIEVEIEVEFSVKTRAVVNVFTDKEADDPLVKAEARGYVSAEVDRLLDPVHKLMDEDVTTLMNSKMIFSGGEVWGSVK